MNYQTDYPHLKLLHRLHIITNEFLVIILLVKFKTKLEGNFVVNLIDLNAGKPFLADFR